MKAWLDLLRRVLMDGIHRDDRTGVGTLSRFGEMIQVKNAHSFPAVTTKHLAFKQCMGEMACFIRGNHSLDAFHAFGCTIWDGNGNAPHWKDRARFEGDLGRIYGVQWRDWTRVRHDSEGDTYRDSTDQLRLLVEGMKQDPYGRRHIVTAWNPAELDQMSLPPCPLLFQCYVRGTAVDMVVYQRSCDLFLGLPFDIAGYAVLQRLIARELGFTGGNLTFFIGDAHIYKNHTEQVMTVLGRKPSRAPTLQLAEGTELWSFQPEQAKLMDYLPHPAVHAPLNV